MAKILILDLPGEAAQVSDLVAGSGGVEKGEVVLHQTDTIATIAFAKASEGSTYMGILQAPRARADKKDSTEVITQFAKAYWHIASGGITAVSTGALLVGFFLEASANGDTSVRILFDGTKGA